VYDAEMRAPLLLACLTLACGGCGKSPAEDTKLVGTWDLEVPTAAGSSRWVWNIRENSTYDFHAEGPGDTPSHSGTFSASKGKYTLISTTMAWNDSGTYQLAGDDTLVASGRLGTASWRRVRDTSTDVVSMYQCSGIPYADMMFLHDDGTYEIDGSAFGRPVRRLGEYTVDSVHVRLHGTLDVEGNPELTQKNEQLEFDVQPDRGLKASGEMAQLPWKCTRFLEDHEAPQK
jgi:hypothetical protein